jgi:hypothetical protein
MVAPARWHTYAAAALHQLVDQMTSDEAGTAEDENLGVAHGLSGRSMGCGAAFSGILGDRPTPRSTTQRRLTGRLSADARRGVLANPRKPEDTRYCARSNTFQIALAQTLRNNCLRTPADARLPALGDPIARTDCAQRLD